MIECRSPAEIEQMAKAGRIVAKALKLAGELIEPGISTFRVDREIEKLITGLGGRPAFKGYRGYPASTCISVDAMVVHGIPSESELELGQLVGVDVGVELAGYYADAAVTIAVGEIDEEGSRLMSAGQRALAAGVAQAKPGNYLNDISTAIQQVAEADGFSVVRDFVGHGIGRQMHEEPQIPNFAQANRGPKLGVGMVLALEPMVNAGGYEVEVLEDGWAVVTKDGMRSVHYEHTVALTAKGPRVLTVL